MESILSLSQGCCLILASEDEIYNQEKFESLFSYSSNNMFFSTPTKLNHYIENSHTSDFVARIKNMIVGGEVFDNGLLKKILEFSACCHIFNIYGPTETTMYVR